MFFTPRDYRRIDELDRYDAAQMDDEQYSDLSMSERLAAERELRKRDREEGTATGRMRPGILYGEKQCLKPLKNSKQTAQHTILTNYLSVRNI
jgi:hypothetical protein